MLKRFFMVLGLLSSSAFATEPAREYTLVATPLALEVHMAGSLAVMSIERPQIDRVVEASDRVARGEAAPACAMVEYETDSSVCYDATQIDLKLFGGFAVVSLPTAEVRAALRASQF